MQRRASLRQRFVDPLAVYDWIGGRRYRLFGKRDACWTPQPELAERFLDSGDA